MRGARGALPRGGGRRRRAPVLEPRGGRPLPPRARDRRRRTDRATLVRIGEKLGDVSLRLGRVDEAIGVWQECLDWHRGQEDLERVADLHRKIGAALSHKGERKRGDRALPEGHQPAEGRPAAHRAGAPLRGGRLALPPHGRQHARHLRLREGAAAGRAARRDARGQPRARDLRPGVRPHRRHREGAPEPRARRGARARLGRRRDDPGAVGARAPPRDLGGRRGGRARRPTSEALALAEQVGMLPAQVELHAWLAQLAAYARRLGAAWSGRPRRAPSSPSARGSWASSASPTRCAASCAGARAGSRRPTVLFHQRPRAGRAGGLVRDRLPGAVRPGARPARLGRPTRAPPTRSTSAIDVCERAGLIAQSIQATAARAVVLALAQRPAGRARGGGEAAELAERLHYPIGRAAALEARGRLRRGPGRGRGAAGGGRDRLARAGPAARGRPLPPAGRPALLASADARARPRAAGGRGRGVERLGVPHLAAQARASAGAAATAVRLSRALLASGRRRRSRPPGVARQRLACRGRSARAAGSSAAGSPTAASRSWPLA